MFWDLFVTWPNNKAQQKRMIEMAITRQTHTQHLAARSLIVAASSVYSPVTTVSLTPRYLLSGSDCV